MSQFIEIFIIGISLSLDAFSLSLIYGTINLSKRKMIILSLVVGIYHFIMPLLGSVIGKIIITNLFLAPAHLVAYLFILIAIEMTTSIYKREKIIILNFIGILLFGLAVSIDSFLTGIGLGILYDNIIYCSLIFMILSSIFTYIGLLIGGKINYVYGKYSTILGSIFLIIIAIYYLLK